MAAAIVAADASIPVILALPEANLGLLAVLASLGTPDRAQELRVFDLLSFSRSCARRTRTPPRAPSATNRSKSTASASSAPVSPTCIASLAATLRDHGLASGRIRFDDLRIGDKLKNGKGLGITVADGLDQVMRARVVKTEPELEAFRRVGKIGDKSMAGASAALAAEQRGTRSSTRSPTS